ncbi:MAG: carboxypeptidase-like regulatory domain-containing protein [Marinifilaceae bacterium]
MKNNVNEVFNMGNVLITWSSNNATKLEGQPKVMEVLNLVKDEHTQLDLNIGVQQQNLQAYTVGKRVKKKNLVTQLFACCTLLYNHALQHSNQEEATKLKVTKSSLERMKTTKLLKFAEDTVELCSEKGEALAETGITTERLDALDQATNEFRTSLTKPVEMRNMKKMATKIMDQSIRKIMWLIVHRLTPLMTTYFGDDPVFLGNYLNAVDIHREATHKLAIWGTILNAETGEPVTNTWLEIPGTDISYRATGKKGHFRIQHLESGSYQLTCTKGDYHPLTVEFTQVWGETTKLNLKLQMTEKGKEKIKRREEEEREKRQKQRAMTSVN